MDLPPFNLQPSRRSVRLLSTAYAVLALLACCFLFSASFSVWWKGGLGILLVALGIEFQRSYRHLRQRRGILIWDDGLGIHWQDKRWLYRSSLFLGRAGVLIWVRRERVESASAGVERWPAFERFSREPIWLLPDMLSHAEWRRLCAQLVQTEQLLAEYR